MAYERDIQHTIVALMGGVVYKDSHPQHWTTLIGNIAVVNDYFSNCGLVVLCDEVEGYAFLKQKPVENESDPLRRLIPRKPLGFRTSLVCLLLRKRLAEHDATSSDPRLIMTETDIYDMVKAFLPTQANESKTFDKIVAEINTIARMKFIDEIKSDGERTYEVRRIIKAAFNVDILNEFDSLLERYSQHVAFEF